jgi:hypothetical protein
MASLAIPAAVGVLVAPSTPDVALRHVASVARSGDVVATRPAGKFAELAWSVGVRGHLPYHDTAIRGLGNASGLVLGRHTLTGRIWLLNWRPGPIPSGHGGPCAPTWSSGSSQVVCRR